jgi:glycosyltransferase involved in cell wall biosynthesis
LYNVPELQQVEQSSLLRNRLGIPSTQAIVLHQGKMQKDRGCLLLVKAIQKINRAALVFLGDGPLRPILEEEVRNAGLAGTVYFHDPVSPEHLLAHTASADIGVTLLEDTCLNHRFALPNKLFEYLMAGLPVLASDLLEIERVVTEWDVGKVVYPEDPDAVAGVLQAMLDAPDQLKRWAANTPRVFETFNWESASEDFKHVYRNLLDAGVE